MRLSSGEEVSPLYAETALPDLQPQHDEIKFVINKPIEEVTLITQNLYAS
jgi:hypothetical protein